MHHSLTVVHTRKSIDRLLQNVLNKEVNLSINSLKNYQEMNS